MPRRLWASSRFEFRADPHRRPDGPHVDDRRRDDQEGRTGKLVFVKVRHELRTNGAAGPALVEFHDIVYCEAQWPGDIAPPPQKAEANAPWQREIVPDDVLLFRYSALTFNSHRIHYDRKCVTEVEGYPASSCTVR